MEVPYVGFALLLFLACSASLALAFPASKPTWLNFPLLRWRNTFAELDQDHLIRYKKTRAISHCSCASLVPGSAGIFPWTKVLLSDFLLCPPCPPYTTQVLQTHHHKRTTFFPTMCPSLGCQLKLKFPFPSWVREVLTPWAGRWSHARRVGLRNSLKIQERKLLPLCKWREPSSFSFPCAWSCSTCRWIQTVCDKTAHQSQEDGECDPV